MRYPGSVRTEWRSSAGVLAPIAAILAVAALITTIGADSRWLAALGRIIVQRGGIPRGVPFAAAPTDHWENVPALAEVVFDWLEAGLGDRGLMIAQLLAVGAAMIILARDALAAGAASSSTARALLLAAVGSVASLVIVRVQLFSLVLFPLLLALLRAEERQPSRRIWFVIPILALWSNLHGAALIGLAVALGYLLLSRLRSEPGTTVAVSLAAGVALCLTPAGVHTVSYYHGVLTNEAAQRGQGLWAPLSLTAPLDIVTIMAAVALIAPLRRARPPLWELVVMVGLAAVTIHASRSGVWLLFFLVAPSAVAMRAGRSWERILPVLAVISAGVFVYSVIRGPLPSGGSPAIIARAIRLAHGTPILAPDLLAEQVALAGGRIWVGNPIDAFSHRDQGVYLDWLQGSPGGRRALVGVDLVLATPRSTEQRLMAATRGFVVVADERTGVLYGRAGG